MQPHCRRMQALLLLCTLLSAAIISADAQSCGFGGMDFSSLSHSDITAQVSSTELDGSCLLRICGVLDSTVCRDPLQGGVADAAACLVYTEPTGTVTPGGEWNSQVVWKYVNDDPTQGVQYSMDCDNCEMFSASTTVTFTCATSFGPVVATGSQYVQFYSVPTPLACGGSTTSTGTANGDPIVTIQVSTSFPIACVIALVAFAALMLFHWYAAKAPLPDMTEEERREWDASDLPTGVVKPLDDAAYEEGLVKPQQDYSVDVIKPTSEDAAKGDSSVVALAPAKTLITSDPLVGAWLRRVAEDYKWSSQTEDAVRKCVMGSVTYSQLQLSHIDAAAWEKLGVRSDLVDILSDEAFLLCLSTHPRTRSRRRKPKYAAVCSESKSARSVLKFKLVRRFFRFIVYRSLLVNFTLTLFVSIVVACLDAWFITAQCPQGYSQCVVTQYVINWFAVLYSILSLLVSAALILFCPTMLFRCRCVGSPMHAILSLAALFLSVMDQASMQSLMYKVTFNLQAEISQCLVAHQIPPDDMKTTLDWRLWLTFSFAAVKLVLAVWTYAIVQRLAFMPLLEPQISPKAVARLLYDYYNIRGTPYGLLPTHRCMPDRVKEKDTGADTPPEDGLSTPMLSIAQRDEASSSAAAYASLAVASPTSPLVLLPHEPDHSHIPRTCGETPILRTYDVDLPAGEPALQPHFLWMVTVKFFCCQRRMSTYVVLIAFQCFMSILQGYNLLESAAHLSSILSDPNTCAGPPPPVP